MRGRKPKQESRASEFYERLAAWKQLPQSSRPALRALARQLDTSHQLLSHYLQRYEKWQSKECTRRANEIRARSKAENRFLTSWEAMEVEAHDRTAMRWLIGSALAEAMRKWEREIKQAVRAGRPPAPQTGKLLQLIASKGNQQARNILQRYFQRSAKDHTNNLPLAGVRAAKSFKSVEGVAGNSSKTLSRVQVEINQSGPRKMRPHAIP